MGATPGRPRASGYHQGVLGPAALIVFRADLSRREPEPEVANGEAAGVWSRAVAKRARRARFGIRLPAQGTSL